MSICPDAPRVGIPSLQPDSPIGFTNAIRSTRTGHIPQTPFTRRLTNSRNSASLRSPGYSIQAVDQAQNLRPFLVPLSPASVFTLLLSSVESDEEVWMESSGCVADAVPAFNATLAKSADQSKATALLQGLLNRSGQNRRCFREAHAFGHCRNWPSCKTLFPVQCRDLRIRQYMSGRATQPDHHKQCMA